MSEYQKRTVQQLDASGGPGGELAGPGAPGHGLRHSLRGVGYADGSAALKPSAPVLQRKEGAATTFKSGDPKGRVASLHPLLQPKARALVENANKKGLDVWVFEGMRSVARQNELYAQGRTKPGKKVTWVKGGGSYHNYGMAIDVIFHGSSPWGEQHDWTKLGEAGEAAGLEWGGRWKNKDRPHFQMPGFPISKLKEWLAAGGMDHVWKQVSAGGGAGDPPAERKQPTETAASGTGTITASALNVRSAPGGDKVGLVKKGDKVKVLAKSGEWLKIEFAGGAAYVHSGYVDLSAAPPTGTKESGDAEGKDQKDAGDEQDATANKEKKDEPNRGVVTASALNVRDAPNGTTGKKVGKLVKGATVDVLAKVGEWLKISFGGGEAYVHGGYVDLKTEPPDATDTTKKKEEKKDAPITADLATLLKKDRLSPAEVAKARELIAKQPADKRGDLYEELQKKVSYHSQRDNESNTAGATINNMCNLTTLAMCLEYLGLGNPGTLDGKTYKQYEDYLEALRVKKGLPHRTTGAAMEGLAKAMGAKGFTWLIGSWKNTKKADWTGWNNKYLRAGYAILLSIGGHIVRVQGVSTGGVVVDDPYGQCKLLASTGADKKYSYGGGKVNTGNQADAKGEDNTWPWSEVEAHAMKWMVAIGR